MSIRIVAIVEQRIGAEDVEEVELTDFDLRVMSNMTDADKVQYLQTRLSFKKTPYTRPADSAPTPEPPADTIGLDEVLDFVEDVAVKGRKWLDATIAGARGTRALTTNRKETTTNG